jgi:hypothetical protein
MALATPFMAVLGTIVYQQQDAPIGDTVGQQVEQPLGMLVDPVQVFEDHHQRLLP